MRPIVCSTQDESGPSSLLAGVGDVVCQILGVKNLRHRSALFELGAREHIPGGAIAAVYDQIASNWRVCRLARPALRSVENWRWRAPQLGISARNASPEVVLERALVCACERRGRDDWANQVPVASGIAGARRERRRAIDLVHQAGPGHFELIELKIASDTPLYAAIEIVGYVCIWLLARAEGAVVSPLLAADRIAAKVLAPSAYYSRYRLGALQRLLNQELAALGETQGAKLSFGFEAFPGDFLATPSSDEGVLALFEQRQPI